MRPIRLSLLAATGVFAAGLGALTAAAQAAPPQSPIKLTLPAAPSNPAINPLGFNYGAAATLSSVERHAAGAHAGVEAFLNSDPFHTMTVDNRLWRLKRFHFHHASEHTLGGQAKAMEIHLVHHELIPVPLGPITFIEDSSSVLVVGRWIVPGAANAALGSIIKPAADYDLGVQNNFNLTSLIPAVGDRQSWRYDGSLTTGATDMQGNILAHAKWVFLKSELTMTNAQINSLSGLFAANARAPYNVANAHNLRWDIPAPGSVALVVLAGLTATRRRRTTVTPCVR